ncbi:MAG: 23S rRNA (guanosine(2251)-2'-O)-methyltransferase RlmB [Candidatus Coatesbacteria bacterium]
MSAVLAGRRAVLEALRVGAGRVTRVYLLEGGRGGILRELHEAAASARVPVEEAPREMLDQLAEGRPHQGVVALAASAGAPTLDDVLRRARDQGEAPFIVVLDEIKDPQNAGAIVRTAECAGAHGLVMTERRSAPVGPGMERSSAGAIEHLPVVIVGNLRQALDRLKEAGVWAVGADMAGTKAHTDADFVRPVALVLGEEGKGLRDLTKKTCDDLVRIPMKGKIGSLNVSAAAAVLCFEVVRQRGLVR